jgi:hypothetical protein
LRASSIWLKFVTSINSIPLPEPLTFSETPVSSALLSESSRSVQPELNIRKQKIAKRESDFIKGSDRKGISPLSCILCNRFITVLPKIFLFYFLAKKQEKIVGYQDILIYSSATNVISILLKLPAIRKKVMRKILAVMSSINERSIF